MENAWHIISAQKYYLILYDSSVKGTTETSSYPNDVPIKWNLNNWERIARCKNSTILINGLSI